MSNLIDEYQDQLVNVHLGLDSYSYFSKFKTIASSLHKKKVMGRQHTLARGENKRNQLETQIAMIDVKNQE